MSAETRLVARRTPDTVSRYVPAVLALAAVALELAYPLLDDVPRDRVTVAIVAVFAAANVAHAVLSRSSRFAVAMLAVTAGGGFAIEQIGVHTGLPFGTYTYGPGLGPAWFGVPPLVALAWTMLAWPSAVAAHALVRGRGARVLVGAWALAVTDLFLDPQMVHAGYWTWHDRSPHLPGVGAVPLSNYGGWLIAALVISAALQWLLGADDGTGRGRGSAGATGPDRGHRDRLPILLYLWLCAGWIVALAIFLDLPAAAGWGALGSGPVVLALAARLRAGRA